MDLKISRDMIERFCQWNMVCNNKTSKSKEGNCANAQLCGVDKIVLINKKLYHWSVSYNIIKYKSQIDLVFKSKSEIEISLSASFQCDILFIVLQMKLIIQKDGRLNRNCT